MTVDLGLGATESANRHQMQRATDVTASLDALQALCPNLRRVAVVVSWFGTDLRAGQCRVVPKVETALKSSLPEPWSVAGLSRERGRGGLDAARRHDAGLRRAPRPTPG